MKKQLSYVILLSFLPFNSLSAAEGPANANGKFSDALEACLIKNSHRHMKDGVPSGDGKDKIYSAEEEAWKDCRQGRSWEDDPWLASEVQIVRAKVRMQLTWELMNEHGA